MSKIHTPKILKDTPANQTHPKRKYFTTDNARIFNNYPPTNISINLEIINSANYKKLADTKISDDFKKFADNSKSIRVINTNSSMRFINRIVAYIAVTLVLVCTFGIFLTSGELLAQTTTRIHINEQEYRTQYYTSGIGGWGNWSGWSDGGGSSYTGTDYGYNYFANVAGLISLAGTNYTAGGIVELCTDIKGNAYHTNTYQSGYSYEYRSGWNTGTASRSSVGGNLNVNGNAAVTLLNTLVNVGTSSTPFTITTMNKNGTGTLILDRNSNSALYLNSTTFTGNGGSFIIGNSNSVQYTSTTSNVGSTSGFNTTINSGSTWTAGNLTAHDYFNINGSGIINASTTTISGTTTSGIANFNTGPLAVGVAAGDGNFIVTSGNIATTTANIANSNHNGLIRLNGAGVNWSTSGLVNVGNTGNNNTGTIDVISGVWNANNQINIANTAGGNGIVNLAPNGTWNATNQTVNVGLNGIGTVNQTGGTWTNNNSNIGVNNGSKGYVRQSGGTWTNNHTRVGIAAGALGDINQSGGTHTDQDAVIAVSGVGNVSVHGNGTQWITNDQNGLSNDSAIIGQNIGSNGIVSIFDNATWAIGDSSNTDNLVTAYEGKGELNVYSNAKVNVAGEHRIADGAASYGTDRVHSGGELNISGETKTGLSGAAQLKVYNGGKVNIAENHLVGLYNGGYGSVQVDGVGSVMNIDGVFSVGHESGTAGGYYVYYPENSRDSTYGVNFNNAGKTTYDANSLGGGSYKDPETWLGSPNLDLRLNDPNWNMISEDAPGLAITAGGVVNVHGADGVKIANYGNSYGYVLLDSKNSGTGRSTLNIDNDLTMGVLASNHNNDNAYVRIINGSLISVGGQAIIANAEGTKVNVRVNGSQGSNNASLEIAKDLTVAKGVANNSATEGNLYVYDKGNVEVGKGGTANMTIAETNNTYGRVHVDGVGSKITVNGLLTVAKEGNAGGRYKRTPDGNPNNDHINNPSHLGTWFDSPNTLTNLTLSGGLNDNSPGLLISRGANVTSQQGNVATADQSYGYVAIDGKDSTALSTKWTITDSNLIIADKGEAYARIFNGGLLETKNAANGDIIIANDNGSIATVRVFAPNSKIDSARDLTISKLSGSDGQLLIYDGASGHVGGNMIIADEADTHAQVHIDGAGAKLEVEHRLTVGRLGSAGGYYNENRYEPATSNNPTVRDTGFRLDPHYLTEPSDQWWFDSPNMDLRNNKNYEGNAPGLAITDGGLVVSGSGLVGERSRDGDLLDSVGYVLIDNRYGYNGENGRKGYRSTWHIKETAGSTEDQNGDLIIGREGKGFVRVRNGGLLEVDGHTKLNAHLNNNDTANYNYTGVGSLYIIGNGGNIRAIPHAASSTIVPSYVIPYADGNRSTWISHKAAVLGDTGTNINGGEATIRISNGAYGETHGIYAGYDTNSRGEVSVTGKASELHIFKDEQLGNAGYEFVINDIKGSGGLSVSDNALLQLHNDSNITLNGMSLISHNSLLHLDKNSIIDSRQYSVKVVNARVEGVGTLTGESGVTFLYDSTYADSVSDPVYDVIEGKFASIVTNPTSAQIDPGLYFGWNAKNEYYSRYGKLTFGDRLTIVGNVNTFFDVNSGWPIAGDMSIPGDPTHQLNDTILVKRGESSTSTADILATLSGTLKIHARLTGYFVDEPSFKVVQTEGDAKSGTFVPGRITRIFDKLEIVPWRFFVSPYQEVRRDADGNDSLWVSMKLKKNPFEESSQTYNERSTGKVLDYIYNLRDDKWLPVLRHFWYLEDPEFLEMYRTLSGEIRAHSLNLPLQNPWTFNQNRFEFRQCLNKSHRHGYDKIDQLDPCEMSKMANNVNGCQTYADKLIKCWNRIKKDMRVWGDYIYEQADYDSDGNAGTFNLNRNGIVVGFDKPTTDGKQLFGMQFAFVRGEIDASLSEAKVDDFNFGIYHNRKIRSVFQWNNYLGMGVENYRTRRSLGSGLAYYNWVWDTPDGLPTSDADDGHYEYSNELYNGNLNAKFTGYSFYANTEFSRPFILGSCNQYMIKPYAALDLTSVWQNSASESGSFKGAEFVRLDFYSTAYIKTYGRTGILFERNGDNCNLHAGLSYAFQLGGRHYSNVDNKFQFGGEKFNIRSVDTGNDFLNLNCGVEWYLGKKKNRFFTLNYQAMFGKNITAQAAQVGYQYKF
ncbi:MAG: hypothetical protein LBB88_08935 [Planctomycetaceae bacterium]|jgi:hypothetical protein|nr:hypothetical protein [Planctomycetaceae bacterium]